MDDEQTACWWAFTCQQRKPTTCTDHVNQLDIEYRYRHGATRMENYRNVHSRIQAVQLCAFPDVQIGLEFCFHPDRTTIYLAHSMTMALACRIDAALALIHIQVDEDRPTRKCEMQVFSIESLLLGDWGIFRKNYRPLAAGDWRTAVGNKSYCSTWRWVLSSTVDRVYLSVLRYRSLHYLRSGTLAQCCRSVLDALNVSHACGVFKGVSRPELIFAYFFQTVQTPVGPTSCHSQSVGSAEYY